MRVHEGEQWPKVRNFIAQKKQPSPFVAKAEQMLKAHSFAKFESENPKKENEIGTKFKKGEAPPGEIHPKEHMEGEATWHILALAPRNSNLHLATTRKSNLKVTMPIGN